MTLAQQFPLLPFVFNYSPKDLFSYNAATTGNGVFQGCVALSSVRIEADAGRVVFSMIFTVYSFQSALKIS